MKAIILNSGIGKRMGHLTKDTPKCLLKINEETILGFQLKAFIENGINNIIITTGPFEDKIKDYIKKYFPQLNVEYVNNPKYASTNYIYSLFLAKDLVDDDILFMHGDLVFEKSVFKKLINAESENSVLINNKKTPPKKDFKGKIENGHVKKIGVNIFEKNCFFLPPIYKFSRESFKLWLNEIENFVKRNEVNAYAENAFNVISEKIKLKPVYFHNEFCIEIDNPNDLEIAKSFFNKKKKKKVKMNQKEYFGFGSIKNIKKILVKNNTKNIFLVTGKKSYELCGAKKAIENLLTSYNITRFYDFSENPKLQDVEKGIKLFKKKDYDTIIAIGGGTVIDMAKLINILAVQTGSPLEYIKKEKKIKTQGKKLFVIPTTAGSGSEATHFAVVYVNNIKHSVGHKYILPNISIVDPTFTMNLPKHIIASTGMDALSQAIESYWSVNSTKESKKYSKEAIKFIMKNLVIAVNNPSKKSREALIKAAHLAGKAINITKTTAPHAISYPITSYFGIPHGHAAALTLGKLLVYNSKADDYDTTDKRGAKYVRKTISEICSLLGASNPESARDKLQVLMKSIGLETDIFKIGIKTTEDIDLIVNNVNVERLINNPKTINKEDLREILVN